MNRALDVSRARLQRLRPSDLAAFLGDGGVVRHVLWFEWAGRDAAFHQRPRQAGDKQRFADAGASALQHDGASRHQNSMPSCAFTPCAKWCFTKVISVTRSAASIIGGFALRPVTTMLRSGRRSFSV